MPRPSPALTRYAAFLRGVMPTNLAMPALKRALEAGGFEDVKTVLASGNAVFSAKPAAEEVLARRCEAALEKHVGRAFPVIVRSLEALEAMLEDDPYRSLKVPAGAKRVVTFLRQEPSPKPKLPIERDGASILALRGREAFSAYVRTASTRGPVFMVLIEQTFGKDVTTRTWETLRKVARRD